MSTARSTLFERIGQLGEDDEELGLAGLDDTMRRALNLPSLKQERTDFGMCFYGFIAVEIDEEELCLRLRTRHVRRGGQ